MARDLARKRERDRARWASLTPEQRAAKNARVRARHAANPGYWRKRKYDLTSEAYDAMKEAQAGRCAVCKEVFTSTPSVDHDKATGQVRGLLCHQCNINRVGAHTVETARKVLAYLEHWSQHEP